MRIFQCQQGSEQWEQVRKGRATASRFGDILTPKTLALSKSSQAYAIELVAEILGIESPPRLPSFDMERGTELEPLARDEYSDRYAYVQEVGFVLPDDSDRWGYSPDGLVGDDGQIEIKCPKAETLIGWMMEGCVPPEHIAQIQGGLWITGREWCDFYAWHPELEPMIISVYPDPKFHDALSKALPRFMDGVEQMVSMLRRRKREPLGFDFAGVSYE